MLSQRELTALAAGQLRVSATPTQPELRLSNKQLASSLECVTTTHVDFGVSAALDFRVRSHSTTTAPCFADGNRERTDIHEATKLVKMAFRAGCRKVKAQGL